MPPPAPPTPSPASLVQTLKARGVLHDPAIEAAFLNVPRHLFLPNTPRDLAYSDTAYAVKASPDEQVISSCSQPSMVAIMLEQLALQPGHNVLEIGAGTGYNAALMQYMAGDRGRVTSIELDKDLAAQAETNLSNASMGYVTIVHGDGAMGFAPRAAYDRIIATVSVWDIPRAWARQIRTLGIMVVPLWLNGWQVSAAFHPQPDGSFLSTDNRPCTFVTLRGAFAMPGLSKRVGSLLQLSSLDAGGIDTAAVYWLLSNDASSEHLGQPLEMSDFFDGGLVPYTALRTPPAWTFALYSVPPEQSAYGLSEQGMALIGQTSACFIPFDGRGTARHYGSADALLAAQDAIQGWITAGRPPHRDVRVRLTPIVANIAAPPAPVGGRVYTRRDHHVQVWLEKG